MFILVYLDLEGGENCIEISWDVVKMTQVEVWIFDAMLIPLMDWVMV